MHWSTTYMESILIRLHQRLWWWHKWRTKDFSVWRKSTTHIHASSWVKFILIVTNSFLAFSWHLPKNWRGPGESCEGVHKTLRCAGLTYWFYFLYFLFIYIYLSRISIHEPAKTCWLFQYWQRFPAKMMSIPHQIFYLCKRW